MLRPLSPSPATPPPSSKTENGWGLGFSPMTKAPTLGVTPRVSCCGPVIATNETCSKLCLGELRARGGLLTHRCLLDALATDQPWLRPKRPARRPRHTLLRPPPPCR